MKTKFAFLLAVLLVFGALTACNANLQSEIIGQWEIVPDAGEPAEIIRFTFDEDGSLSVLVSRVTLAGTYTWLDADTLQMTLIHGETSEEIEGDVRISGNQMKITNEAGDVETLQRVK